MSYVLYSENTDTANPAICGRILFHYLISVPYKIHLVGLRVIVTFSYVVLIRATGIAAFALIIFPCASIIEIYGKDFNIMS
jgi:hypothetical protein